MTDDEQRFVALVARRLYLEVMYELQTGGGVALDGAVKPEHRVTIKRIRERIGQLRALFDRAPRRVARALGMPKHVLDVGAGRAPWSIELARMSPTTRITAIDLPEELSALDEAIRAAAVESQFVTMALDVFRPRRNHELHSESYDLAILANVSHCFDARHNEELLRRVVPLIRYGGVLAIIEQVLDEKPDWARWAALYATGALHSAPGGYIFPLNVHRQRLEGCGCTGLRAIEICPLPPLTLLTAHRTH